MRKYRIKEEEEITTGKSLFLVQRKYLFTWHNVRWFSFDRGFFYYFKTLHSAKKAVTSLNKKITIHEV